MRENIPFDSRSLQRGSNAIIAFLMGFPRAGADTSRGQSLFQARHPNSCHTPTTPKPRRRRTWSKYSQSATASPRAPSLHQKKAGKRVSPCAFPTACERNTKRRSSSPGTGNVRTRVEAVALTRDGGPGESTEGKEECRRGALDVLGMGGYTQRDMPKRQPKDRRQKRPYPMILTPRDLTVLKAVFEARVLSQNQIERLVFAARHRSIAQARLALLFHHGYLERQFLLRREGIYTSPALYLLAERGAQALSRHFTGELFVWSKAHLKVGTFFLAHMLAISEFQVQIRLACRQAGFDIVRWQGERELKKDYDRVTVPNATGGESTLPIIPDSYFVIRTPQGDQAFALEMDRGTMPGKRIETKVTAYLAWLKSGQYQKRYQTKSLRILFVTESARRVKSVKQFIERAGGQSRFWCATLSDLTPETLLLANMWWVAGRDGQQALLLREKGSPQSATPLTSLNPISSRLPKTT